MTMRPFFGALVGLLVPMTASALPPEPISPPAPEAAPAEPQQVAAPASAKFALIIGVNKSLDPDTAPLRYADDDAARYLDLFRSLGARSYLLTRPDDNTRRIHPQAAAEALEPTRAEFDRAIETLAVDLEQARQRHVSTVVYFVYAGHGSVHRQRGYISLEDSRLGASDLEAIVDRLKADQTHFIVDACYSYFLVGGRGPGGRRREVAGFSQLGGLASRPGVGLLFSTSSARESHEWSGFQAGVFSHEVRSGLYGAADVDGDGQVSYREMVAFIDRANASVLNERYRPDVFAHPPAEGGMLVDLREGLRRRIEVKGAETGHYLLEDSLGVRLADFHNAPGQDVHLLKPATAGRLYLRRVRDENEFQIPPGPDVVELARLDPAPVATLERGSANDAFSALFALPFRREDVASLQFKPPPEVAYFPDADIAPSLPAWRRNLGTGLIGAGVASGAAGVITLVYTRKQKEAIPTSASQAEVAEHNDTQRWHNLAGVVAIGAGGAALVAGVAFLFWPTSSPPPVQAEASAHGAGLRFVGSF